MISVIWHSWTTSTLIFCLPIAVERKLYYPLGKGLLATNTFEIDTSKMKNTKVN